MNRSTRRLAVVAAAAAALAVAPAALATPDSLELSVVSSPAQYVSGGDARIEVSVPDKVSLSDVVVKLNGADVTAAFGPDPEGNHQLEGVVTGLPLGESVVTASSHKKAQGNKHNDELRLVEQSDPGADVLRPAPEGLPLRARRPCREQRPATDPAVAHLRDADSRLLRLPVDDRRVPAVRPGRAAAGPTISQTTTIDGKTVRLILRWERGMIDRFIYSIVMLSPADRRPRCPTSRPGTASRSSTSPAASRSATTRAPRAAATMRYLAGLADGLRDRLLDRHAHEHALQPPARRRDGDHGQGPLRLGVRRAGATRSASAAPAARSSSTSTARTIPACSTAAIPQYSYPDMVTQTIHVGDCELLERWADTKAIANPFSMWAHLA